ncbi:hypothetical protein ACWDTD_10755 [Gordonia sp. NPDC003425]
MTTENTTDDTSTDERAQNPVERAQNPVERAQDPVERAQDSEIVRAPRTKAARKASTRRAAGQKDSAQPIADATDDAVTDSSGEAVTDPDTPQKTSRGREISFTINSATVGRVVVALLVVAALAGAGILGWAYHRDQQRLAAFDDAKTASSEFTLKLVSTMNSANVGDMKSLLGPLSTGEFAKNLDREQNDGAKVIRDLNVKATPTIKSVSVESFDATRASTSVLVEVSGTSSIAPSGGKELMLVWLDLANEDGTWKVAKLSGAQAGIGDRQGGDAGGQNPAPTPTPAPAPAPAPGG